MKAKYERGVVHASLVTLVAAALLIPLGFAGIGPVPALASVLLVAVLARRLPRRFGIDWTLLTDLWLGAGLAALVALAGAWIGASPGELQALAGLTGLVGVGNLLLRPVYRLAYYLAVEVLAVGGDRHEGSEG